MSSSQTQPPLHGSGTSTLIIGLVGFLSQVSCAMGIGKSNNPQNRNARSCSWCLESSWLSEVLSSCFCSSRLWGVCSRQPVPSTCGILRKMEFVCFWFWQARGGGATREEGCEEICQTWVLSLFPESYQRVISKSELSSKAKKETLHRKILQKITHV